MGLHARVGAAVEVLSLVDLAGQSQRLNVVPRGPRSRPRIDDVEPGEGKRLDGAVHRLRRTGRGSGAKKALKRSIRRPSA